MAPTLIPSDWVLVNKLILGPRIYTEFNKLSAEKMLRLKGLRKIQRNDILVFNSPHIISEKLEPDLNMFYIKRCIAISGDTFSIENGVNKVKDMPIL